jgi:hypothetical protein
VDIVRKIQIALPIDKYGHIITMVHQVDLSTSTPTQILGMINTHEMYMHTNNQDETSSNKKKDLAIKADNKKNEKAKTKEKLESSGGDQNDEVKLALMVKKTTSTLKKLNKEGISINSRKKIFFTSSKRKPIS